MFSFPGEPSAEKERERRAALRKLCKLAETLAEARSCPDARGYHLEGIDNGFGQFDSTEPTISHLDREPHPSLGDLSYGQALAQKPLSLNTIPQRARILEVGCGTGLLAQDLLGKIAEERPDLFSGLEDTMTETECLKSKYALSPIAGIPTYVVNVRAIRFFGEVAFTPQPRGLAILSEYGTLTSFPKVVRLHGHNEYSNQFIHLMEVASTLGAGESFLNPFKFHVLSLRAGCPSRMGGFPRRR